MRISDWSSDVCSSDLPTSYKSGITYLDFNILKSFSSDVSDYEFTITEKYNNRPDLLSYELYGSPFLCLIFSLRNPDLLGDPIYDFTTDKNIMVPTSDRVSQYRMSKRLNYSH